MLLSQTAEYALRAMCVLARTGGQEFMAAKELSTRTGIPSHYLSKLMRRLVLAGLVDGRKGHGGGFRLAKPASGISFADVLLAADFEMQPDRCAFGLGKCNAENPCMLHDAWSRMSGEFKSWAEGTTLDRGCQRRGVEVGDR